MRVTIGSCFQIALLVLLCGPGTGLAGRAEAEPLQPVYCQQIHVEGFWREQFKLLTEKWIPHCIKQMEAGGAGQELLNLVYTGQALRGEPHGEFRGAPWSDAYIYNTMESICLALAIDAEGDDQLAQAQQHLRDKMNEWIPIILAAQCEDGYIHSFHTVNKHPRYSNTAWHEFYVQGYFIEMGVAHYRITGGADRRLYDAAVRCADQLLANFGPDSKRRWVHGHEGMGYALCRLGRLVSEVEGAGQGDKYIQLAKHLLDNRNSDPQHRNPYDQTHLRVVDMTDAVGHAVRGTYLYTALADLALLTGDEGYRQAVDRIWNNAIHCKHYITGGVGASHHGEAFAGDYELPEDGYCESCAGCGLTFWADRMLRMHGNAHYLDVQERTLYNNVLGAIERSGENFFYQNPLSSDKARYPWHGCPCCVGNIPRTLLGLKDQIYATNAEQTELSVCHFVAGTAQLQLAGRPVVVTQETNYPWDGMVRVTLQTGAGIPLAVRIRVPDRSESLLYSVTPNLDGVYTVKLNGQRQSLKLQGGFVVFPQRVWNSGDTIELELPMEVQRVHCDQRVQSNRGRVALIRGPLAYNVEQVDHQNDVRTMILPPTAELTAVWNPDLLGGVMTVQGAALARADQRLVPVRLTAVPNFVRLNRGGYSQVWLVEDPDKIEQVRLQSEPVIKRIVREPLDRLTLDRVVVGDAKSEQDHHLQGQATGSGVHQEMLWRHATDGGWFSYELRVQEDVPSQLLVTYWGSDAGNRRFVILVDGQEIARQQLEREQPGEFFDRHYELPQQLLQAQEKVTVRFQAEEGAMAGGIFDLRIVRPAKD